MTIDITYSKNQRKTLLKEVIRPDGTKEKVSYAHWRETILREPLGATAEAAAKAKDPDLEKVKVKTIPVGAFTENSVQDPKKPNGLDLSPTVGQTLVSNVKTDTAKRMGFRTEQEGKTRKK